MKYTMQELKDIYREASARSDNEEYEHIAERVERVLKGETKCCRFQLWEKDLISACFVEDDDACIVNGTYDEHVKRYGDHAELVMKTYGVKKAKAQTAETAVTETEQTEVGETAETETAETDDSGFEYYSVETAEVSKEVKEQFEKQKTSFKFYDVGIAYQVERYVNCGSLKYVQLGTYSDYAKAVKAAQEAIESWGEENIYFHTVEFAKRSSEPIKNNKKVFKSETHEIDYYWISARLTDTKECGYVNIDTPIRIPNV